MALTEIRKTVINVLTLIVGLGAEPLFTQALHWLPATDATLVGLLLGVATAALHYLVPNTTDSPARAQKISARYVPRKAKRGTAAPAKGA